MYRYKLSLLCQRIISYRFFSWQYYWLAIVLLTRSWLLSYYSCFFWLVYMFNNDISEMPPNLLVYLMKAMLLYNCLCSGPPGRFLQNWWSLPMCSSCAHTHGCMEALWKGIGKHALLCCYKDICFWNKKKTILGCF